MMVARHAAPKKPSKRPAIADYVRDRNTFGDLCEQAKSLWAWIESARGGERTTDAELERAVESHRLMKQAIDGESRRLEKMLREIIKGQS